jgi:hypothetical protein
MNRLWLVTNPASGSTSSILTVSIEAAVRECGCIFAGRTGFPEEALPTAGKLEDAAVDTLVLFEGDGTINATLGALGAWRESFLILPGGTMNLLAKALHDTLDPVAIVKAAFSLRRLVSLPIVKAGQHRALRRRHHRARYQMGPCSRGDQKMETGARMARRPGRLAPHLRHGHPHTWRPGTAE